MAVANKEMKVGQELPTLRKLVTLNHIRLFSNWANRNLHTDWEYAKKAGLPTPIGQGLQSNAYICQMLINFFGADWLKGGNIDVRFLAYLMPGDIIDVKGVVEERNIEGDSVRFTCRVWCQNQAGQNTCAGTASALVRE